MKSLISRDKKIMGGQYCIRGTRVTVNCLKSLHKGGDSVEILAAIYDLSRDQVNAAVNFGIKTT